MEKDFKAGLDLHAKNKHFHFMWQLTKGMRYKYVLNISCMFFTVLLGLINIFIGSILIDTLTILLNKPVVGSGPVGDFILMLMGGRDFLIANLWVFAIWIFGLALIVLGVGMFQRYMRGNIGNSLQKRFQMLLFTHLEQVPYTNLKHFKSGDIIQTCTRDLRTLQRFMGMQTNLIFYTIYTILFTFLLLISIDWRVALVTIALIPLLFLYSFFAIKKVRKLYRIADDSEGQLMTKIEENLAAVRTVKVYNNEEYELGDFDKYIQDYSKKYVKWRLFSATYFSTSDIFVFGQILFSMIMCSIFTLNGEISVGTFTLSFTYVNMIVWPVREVATILSNLAQAYVSVDRFRLILSQPIEDLISGATPPIRGEIVCRDLSYHYEGHEEDTLHKVNLTIKAGETVAIIGKTGSGKSTFVHLLSALFDYTGGSIKLDGVELRDYAKGYLRQNIASVLQDPFLFSKTIIGNLRLVKEDLQELEVALALKTANLEKTIETLPLGINTELGEKGTTLSGGQKQRLSIARSLIQKAPIMIFDDSLSALDTQTDFEIRQRLKERQEKATTIIVTHRMTTAKDADKIIVFDAGKIAEIGSHTELMKNNGMYRKIYEIQTGLVAKELHWIWQLTN